MGMTDKQFQSYMMSIYGYVDKIFDEVTRLPGTSQVQSDMLYLMEILKTSTDGLVPDKTKTLQNGEPHA
ncbi:MAG: hypothetical protein LBL98_04945 [Ruminococcus sp.]|jgi:hypothetical protein|nr:hypothetical protein [Ruminococcus sp.]